jgi:hypothetical protein
MLHQLTAEEMSTQFDNESRYALGSAACASRYCNASHLSGVHAHPRDNASSRQSAANNERMTPARIKTRSTLLTWSAQKIGLALRSSKGRRTGFN